MRLRAAFLAVGIVSAASLAAAQTATPKLTRPQRELLQAMVMAVDAAAADSETASVNWQTHILRTSDGAHYVAFTMAPSAALAPGAAAPLYVRLATRAADSSLATAERSAVMEWLKGMRSDPLVAQKQRGIAFGEMPTFGAGGIAARGPGQSSSDLRLLTMERERAQQQKDAAEKARRAALEGTAARPRDALFPFEDFSLDAAAFEGPPTAPVLRRSVTAGPGEYDLYVAWTSAGKDKKPTLQVVKRRLSLPPATANQLTLSDVILAEGLATRQTAYPPDQQSAHPYAIGSMEIAPAADDTFTNDEQLAVVFQVINARPNEAGKPDVTVGFQLFRNSSSGEQLVGALNPQHYNPATLPVDFDLNKGHPLFAAMAAPLKTLPRGQYRLRITASDKLAGQAAEGDVAFRIIATPATLLATAPVGIAFRRETLLTPAILREVAARLQREPATAAMTTAIEAAREQRFVELLREDAVEQQERPARSVLRGIGLLALGDPRMACTMLRQAVQAEASAVARLYVGACLAIEGHDGDAIAEWQQAESAGAPAAIVEPLLVDAYLRVGDVTNAAVIAARDKAPERSVEMLRPVASVYVTQQREREAIPLVERRLAVAKDDLDAQFVLVHALFASVVRDASATDEAKGRFRAAAQRYLEAKGRHAGIVTEWLEVVR